MSSLEFVFKNGHSKSIPSMNYCFGFRKFYFRRVTAESFLLCSFPLWNAFHPNNLPVLAQRANSFQFHRFRTSTLSRVNCYLKHYSCSSSTLILITTLNERKEREEITRARRSLARVKLPHDLELQDREIVILQTRK